MKKSLSLALFVLLNSSLLHAKGGLEKILSEPEQDLHLKNAQAIKKQKARALEGGNGSSVIQGFKRQYEIQIIALEEIIKEYSLIHESSSEYLIGSREYKIHSHFYNSSKNKIKILKSQLTPEAKLQLNELYNQLCS